MTVALLVEQIVNGLQLGIILFLVAAGLTLECPESCLSTAGCTRWTALAAFSVAFAMSSLRYAVGTHRVRCRVTPDSVATRGIEGFMSV